MSLKLSAWAIDTGRSAGKAMSPALRWLLVCVADRQNGDTGYTFVKPRKLAEDHGATLDWVKGGLRQLEDMGLIARVKRLKTDGSHDTNLLIVLDGPEACERAAALGWTKPVAGAPDAEDEPQDVGGGGENHPTSDSGEVGVKSPPRGGENHPTSIDEPGIRTLNPQPPPRVSPPSPPSADLRLGMVPAALPAEALSDGYDPDPAGANAFLTEWQASVNHSTADVPEVIRRIWRKLDAGERKRARGDLEAWRRQQQRERRPFGSATRYLRDKAWQVLDGLRAARREGTAPSTFFIREGSPEWEAWAAHEARHGRRMTAIPSQHEKGRGWWMPTLWPPRAAQDQAGSARPDSDEDVARILASG